MKRVSFHKIRSQQVWRVSTEKEDSIGRIEWDRQWKKFTYWPECSTVYTSSCMREIADFLDSLKDGSE